MSRTDPKNVELSKKLSWLLRHGAEKKGFAIQPDGFICVADILQHPHYGSCYTLSKLQEIVSSDAKQRYTLRRNPKNGAFEIRANQGHSLVAVQDDSCLVRIVRAAEVATAVHGTYYRHWMKIKVEGLKRFQRNHIHFAVNDKLSEGDVISGFRHDCQLLIYLNVHKVLADNLPLYRSSNNVVLCSGVNGCISPKYFNRVIDRHTGEHINL